MRVLRQSNNEIFDLGDASLIASGGEARIHALPGDMSLVAKLYHKPSLERAGKLQYMLAHPPVDPAGGERHNAIAWPSDLLRSAQFRNRVVGFLMPRVAGMRRVIDFFNPKTRRQECPLFNYFYLVRTARNLVTAVRALHERGYVVGDVNESNILVSDRALVTLVDTDSFQVCDAENGMVYRCRVGKPEFTPPELQGKSFAQLDRQPTHDLFGVGVVLFQLLMEGTHPFAGAFTGQGDPPPYEKRISTGHFPHASQPRVPYRPSPAAPSFYWLHPLLQNLFIRCFHDGHLNPALRPDTQSWQWALEEVEKSLATCWINDQHLYSSHLESCPWCERAKLLGGRDPFPSVAAVKRGDHLRAAPRARTPKPGSSRMVVPRPSSRASTRPVGAGFPLPRKIPSRTVVITTVSTIRRSRPSSKTLVDWHSLGWPKMPNYWAWTSMLIGLVTAYYLWTLPRSTAGALYIFGVLGLVAGITGEVRAQSWDLDGRGKWIARAGIAINSTITVVSIWYLFM